MSEASLELLSSFVAFLAQLANFLGLLGRKLLPWLPVLAWCAWWLWCADWKKAWPVLARGAWVPVVLFVLVVALAWSRITSSPEPFISAPLPNFWWQLGACTGMVLLALFCGYLQGRVGGTPPQ